MDLALSPAEEMLQRTAREFLETECPRALARAMEQDPAGYPPAVWAKIADLGWLGLPFPEEYGGLAGSAVELALLSEELGRSLAPLPFQETVVQAGLALLFAGSAEQKAEYLPRIIDGSLLATIAQIEPGIGVEPRFIGLRAEPEGGGYRLAGTKIMVQWANVANEILVIARTGDPGPAGDEGLSLFLVSRDSAGLEVNPMQTIAETPSSEVVFEGVQVPAERLVGPLHGGWRALWPARQRAVVAKCAEMCGGAAVAHSMSVDYAKSRVAFGRPIGAFQAIQHKLVGMQNHLDSMRYAALYAAWRFDQGLPADYWVSVAKASASDGYRLICFEGHEIHAGIGFMREYDLQMYYRRAKLAEVDFGDGLFHRGEIARLLRKDLTVGRI